MANECFPSTWYQEWNWEGLKVSFIKADCVKVIDNEEEQRSIPSIVLIHGFGACKEHWRHNVNALRSVAHVLAIDLVGFGQSDKPQSKLEGEEPVDGSYRYGIDLWGKQVVDVVEAHTQGSTILIGNSIGGVVALAAADRLEKQGRPAVCTILIDCAQRALDDKRLSEQPPLRRIARPLLKAAVRQRWLTSAIFGSITKPGIIRRVLLQAYPTAHNVDEQLVDILLKPALEPGAKESFRGFVNLFQDRIAPEFLERLTTTVILVWGEKDPWEPIEEARKWQRFTCIERLYELPNIGHCPHDEAPDQVNDLIIEIVSKEELAK